MTLTRSLRSPRPALFVYFVRATQSGLIKIGSARNLTQRLSCLQTGSPEPLELLGVIRHDRAADMERRLHGEFQTERHRGEWFRPSGRLLAFVARVAKTPEQACRDEASAAALRIRAEEDSRRLTEALGVKVTVRPGACIGRPGRPSDDPKPRLGRKAALAAYKAARGLA